MKTKQVAGGQQVAVAYVLSYKAPSYVRSNSLRAMLRQSKHIRLVEAINTSKGIARYGETLRQLIRLRLREKPDVYVLGFRGHDIYWPVRLITLGKPLVFDEFLNAYDWVTQEHKKWHRFITGPLVWLLVASMLHTSQLVLADTKLHAERSRTVFKLPARKLLSLYVGTDEDLFTASAVGQKPAKKSERVQVLFYGTFLPLHGIEVIRQAARQLEDSPIDFTIIGGSEGAFADSPNITHHTWVEYETLPNYIAAADICLGGPFGNTPQSQKVITGKTFQFLHMKKPVIVGKIAEDSGFVDKQNCLLIDQGDAQALTEAIVWAAENRDKLASLATGGYKLYERSFSVAAQGPLFEQRLLALVGFLEDK